MQGSVQDHELFKRRIGDLFADPQHVYVIHYALQQLRRDQQELAPPVAAIALRNVGSSQGRVFSIKAEADFAGIDLSQRPTETTLKRLEYGLLFRYNAFLASVPQAHFVHWYMRDDKFGFPALEHRFRKALSDLYKDLQGPRSVKAAAPYGFAGASAPFPVVVDDARKVDLAQVIRTLSAGRFISLRELADRNGLSHAELIDGRDEPEVFEAGNHARLQWSTSTKVRLIADLLALVHRGSLRLEPRRDPTGADGRIFINYRREDTEAASGRLHDRLSLEFGTANVFIDTDDIPAGIDFVEQLAREIDGCDVFLAVIGRRWSGLVDASGRQRLADPADFVRREIHAALTRNIPVIPVLVDGAAMPQSDQLPADLQPLLRRQAVEVRNSQFAYDADRLTAKLRQSIVQAREGQRRWR